MTSADNTYSSGIPSDGDAGPDGQATGGKSLGTVAGGVNVKASSMSSLLRSLNLFGSDSSSS